LVILLHIPGKIWAYIGQNFQSASLISNDETVLFSTVFNFIAGLLGVGP